VLIRYLENDATKMEDALNQFSRSRTYIDEKSALAYHLYNKLTNHAITDEETDLRPADATSIRKAVLAKLKRVRE
jgi:rhamnogalacturonyl hydrolase YesR